MHHLPHYWYFLLFAISFIAGAINSVAGGGTLLTFPSSLAAGITPVIANATNTISLVPASVAGAFSFRKELPSMPSILKLFALPAIFRRLHWCQADVSRWRCNTFDTDPVADPRCRYTLPHPRLSRRLNLLIDPDDDNLFKRSA